jgi:hypothetical protein
MIAHKVLWLAVLCVTLSYAARIQYANSYWRPSLYAREASYRYVLGNTDSCTRGGMCSRRARAAVAAVAGTTLLTGALLSSQLTSQQIQPVLVQQPQNPVGIATGTGTGVQLPGTITGTSSGGQLPSMTSGGSSALAVVPIVVSPPPPFSSARSNIDTRSWPATARITQDSLHNYQVTLANHANYGLTALIKVTSRGNFEPGTFFLFPGVNPRGSGSERWSGPSPKVNGQDVSPLLPSGVAGAAQHRLLVDLLGLNANDFIGFSVRLRVGRDGSVSNEVGMNSGTCNPNYFGNRTLPTAWERYVLDVISSATRVNTIAV